MFNEDDGPYAPLTLKGEQLWQRKLLFEEERINMLALQVEIYSFLFQFFVLFEIKNIDDNCREKVKYP
jgi:hypothetical protein